MVVETLKSEFAGRVEFAYVEGDTRTVNDAYQNPIVPTLILRHRGVEIARFNNAMSPDEVRAAIAAIV